MNDFVIQLHAGEYHDFARYLTALQFRPIVLATPNRRFHTPGQLMGQYLLGLCQLLPQLPALRKARTLVVFSHFAFVVKVLARCGLLGYERLFCFGFFVHDRRWFRVFRWLVRLDRAEDHYIIFGKGEAGLYSRELGIDAGRLHFVPLGDWRQGRSIEVKCATCDGDYYLAGGRSNRDYVSLVKAFHSVRARLVIVCSETNREDLEQTPLPENVTVHCDVPAEIFDEYVRGAKAGIIPLQYDTGSSGQSVALALMRESKCILATRAGGLEGYLEDGVSGFWIDDLGRDLPARIRQLEQDPGCAGRMGRAARQRYEERFSLTVAASAFENVLATVPVGSPFREQELSDSLSG